jgi:asparagine synthase (glutamine-hydrolysing)
MCGIAGILSMESRGADILRADIDRMSNAIAHRGPDDSGSWIDPKERCALGFRRLAILDLSPNGHQPMLSPSGRFAIIFNGEIYNHLELRDELVKEGFSFRGHSDTETLCAGVEHWGINETIRRCIGMFAIAIWDQESATLSLVRDRLGIKPLYVYRRGNLLLFASELKALKAHPGFHTDIDEESIANFLRYLYIPSPATIFKEVTKIRPGHVMTVAASRPIETHSQAYWSIENAYRSGAENPFDGSDDDAVSQLEYLLLDAVRLRKLSDVPLGALLSGGVDSTTVVAMMQAGASQPTRTFSIGFTSAEHDESRYAAEIAQYLGTSHTTLTLDGSDSLKLVPELPYIFDEPLADPSQIPTYLVCQLARSDVTVALTGDGGDEVFAGYHRYIQGHRLIPAVQRIPQPLRNVASATLRNLSTDWYPAVEPIARMSGQRLVQQKMGKLSRILRADQEGGMYRSLLSAWQDPREVMTRNSNGVDPVCDAFGATSLLPLLDRMMLVDQSTYLPDDLLAKVDRASMAVSLEARVPLLDHRVIEFAWRLPAHMKIRNGRGKWILRQVLNRHVPAELVDRPKVGFSVPIAEWLRGPLRSWGDDIIQSAQEPLDRTAVLAAWQRLQSGDEQYALGMWAVLMLQAWRNAWSS